MISNLTPEDYKFITKVSFLDAKKVFYPLRYALEKRDIKFDDDQALQIEIIPEDLKFPSGVKMADAGQLLNYKVEVTINNQTSETEEQLFNFLNKKVITVFHHKYGKIIIGCNEQPLQFLYTDDNSTSPSSTNGFTIECKGNSYFSKVII